MKLALIINVIGLVVGIRILFVFLNIMRDKSPSIDEIAGWFFICGGWLLLQSVFTLIQIRKGRIQRVRKQHQD
jgi:hypothetical protein